MKRALTLALLALCLFPLGALAQGRPFNPRTPQAMGMGNTRVGFGGSYHALFYNPAGLGTIERAGVTQEERDMLGDALKDVDWELQFVAALFETNTQTRGFLKDLIDVDVTTIEPFLDLHRNEPIFIRVDSTSYFTLKKGRFGFGVALVVDYTGEAAILDTFVETAPAPAGTDTLRTRKTTDAGGVIGFSYDAVEEYLTLGAALKLFNRWQTDAVFGDIRNGIASAAAPDFDFDADLVLPFGEGCAGSASPTDGAGSGFFLCDDESSFAVGGDLGAMGYLPLSDDARLQLGLTLQDIGRTRISGSSFASPSKNGNDIPWTIDAGLAYIHQFKAGRLKVAADFRDLNRTQVDFQDKFSIGAEWEFEKVLTLRAGMNETGFAGGAALRLWLMRLDGGVIQDKTELPSKGRDLRYFAALGFGWYM